MFLGPGSIWGLTFWTPRSQCLFWVTHITKCFAYMIWSLDQLLFSWLSLKKLTKMQPKRKRVYCDTVCGAVPRAGTVYQKPWRQEATCSHLGGSGSTTAQSASPFPTLWMTFLPPSLNFLWRNFYSYTQMCTSLILCFLKWVSWQSRWPSQSCLHSKAYQEVGGINNPCILDAEIKPS